LSGWRIISAKLSLLWTKLCAGFLAFAGATVAIHDALLPVFVAVDWRPITGMLPPWAWPLILCGVGLLFYWLRAISERQTDRLVVAVRSGASNERAELMVATGKVT